MLSQYTTNMSSPVRRIIVDVLAGIGNSCFPRAAKTENKSVQSCFYAGIVTLILLCSLPISMLVIGIQYIEECRGERMIPVYLIVRGVLELILLVYILINITICKTEKLHIGTVSRCCIFTFAGLVILVLLAWLFAGIYWMNHVTLDHDDTTSSGYCHPIVYKFALWITYATLILMSIGIVTGCMVCCCGYRCGRNEQTHKNKHHTEHNDREEEEKL